jgi:hypothetical protein
MSIKCNFLAVVTSILSAGAMGLSQEVRAGLMGGGQKLAGERAFCVEIAVDETQSTSPGIRISAGFAASTTGYFEVDGNRILSWAGKGELGSYQTQSYTTPKTGLYRITLGVESPASVEQLEVTGGLAIKSLRSVSCGQAKRCPQCSRKYPDPEWRFCPLDGKELK